MGDILRSEVQSILREVLADQFSEVRRSLREDLHDGLQQFLAASRHAPGAGTSGRRFSTPLAPPRGSKASSHTKKDGSDPQFGPPPASTTGLRSMQSLQSIEDDGESHEWMFRHIRRFNAAAVLDRGDDDDEGVRGTKPQKQPRVSGDATRPRDDIRPPDPRASDVRSSTATDCVLPVHDSSALDLPKAMQRGDTWRSSSTCSNLGSSNANLGGEPPVGAWVYGCERGTESVGTPDSAPKGYLKQAAMSRLLRTTRQLDFPAAAGRLGRAQRVAKRVVRSHYFDYFICTVVAVNAFTIGVQTNYAAAHRTSELPRLFYTLEVLFCLIFAVEILLRLCVFRLGFFRTKGWEWNVFDFVVVLLQIVELFLGVLPNLSFVRMLRVMRLIRAIRLIRILRYITELRALVASIGASLASLVWTLVLLILMIYMLSLCITQLVVDHRLLNIDDDEKDTFLDLVTYYGTLYRSMLSLFQAVSGGLDWDNCVAPLMDHISIWLAPVFSLYIAFTLLALMNVVTAIFVDSVLETTKKDKNVIMANNVRELFTSVDGGVHEGSMDWDTFQSKLDTHPMIEFFKAIDIDRSEATCLFRLLDLDNGGSVDAEEFLSGCLRLRGPAKALDLALLISEVGKLAQHLKNREYVTSSVNISMLK